MKQRKKLNYGKSKKMFKRTSQNGSSLNTKLYGFRDGIRL